MYAPSHFKESDLPKLHGLIKAHPLGTWVVSEADGMEINHIPFLLDTDNGTQGTLLGHVARANPVWQHCANSKSVVIFTGVHGYISPSWYPDKQEHQRVVPTWNYAIVHVHGVAEVIEDQQWLLDLVTRLTNEHEAARAAPWRVADAPSDYIDKMLGAIVGIRIRIERLEGKFKLSQNRSAADRLGVISGLAENPAGQSTDLADFMSKSNSH